MLFEVTFDRFMEEVRDENIGPDTRNFVEVEEIGEMFVFYLVKLELDKQFVTRVKKEELTDVQRVQIMSLSKPSIRVIEELGVINKIQQLIELQETKDKIPVQNATSS